MLIRRSQRAARGDDVLFQKRTNGSRVSNSHGYASREYSPAGAQEAVRKDRDSATPCADQAPGLFSTMMFLPDGLSRFLQRDLSVPRGTVRLSLKSDAHFLACRVLSLEVLLQAVHVIDAGADLREGACIACTRPQTGHDVSGNKAERERHNSA